MHVSRKPGFLHAASKAKKYLMNKEGQAGITSNHLSRKMPAIFFFKQNSSSVVRAT
jgi:hypothetical protein